jgi:hypothetical protein
MSETDDRQSQMKAFWQMARVLFVLINSMIAVVLILVLPFMWIAGDADLFPVVAAAMEVLFNTGLILTLVASYLYAKIIE